MSTERVPTSTRNDGAALASAFVDLYAAEPDGVWAAPGRVNLIGEHTDYNEGYVLPFAIDRCARVAVRLRPDPPAPAAADRTLRMATLQDVDDAGARPAVVGVSLAGLSRDAVEPWARYIAGVAWAFQQRGVDVPALDVLLDSDVPIGAGLSSSAAIECAVALAIDELTGARLGRSELVLLCRQAENDFVGAPTGILDQSAALLGTADHALFLDCRSRADRQVPLPLAAHGLAILVVDTRISHAHDTGGYKELVAACARGAETLGVCSLRDVTGTRLDESGDALDYVTFHRVRHIVTENERVLETVRLLESATDDAGTVGPAAIGDLLTASHASMRDDFEISCVELDLAVDTALEAGALGARMTGGGFGGSAIALVGAADAESVADRIRSAFSEAGYATPDIFTVAPGPGARRL
ncbi:galactokinase [Arthrobacter sp. KK5.5]|uniref:galactokinase n=1 Tax=Arthrobacter sp. KK5.5 TaxID=3373084 RepID=UPI003EE551C0